MRYEFTKTQLKQIRDRSKGVCEAGKFETESFYGMKPGDTCGRKAVDVDHIVADGLAQRKPQSIDEGLHVCDIHHKIKTHENDRPKINKSRRLRERGQGIKRRKGPPMMGSRDSPFRKKLSGEVERR